MSRRLHMILALVGGIAVTIVLFTPSWGQDTTHYPDVKGVVKSVDVEKGRIVLTDDVSKSDVLVNVGANTDIKLETPPKMGRGGDGDKDDAVADPPKLSISRIKPGTHIVVRDIMEAAGIKLLGQTRGQLKSVDVTGHKLVLTEEGSGKDREIDLTDQAVVVTGKDDKGKEKVADLAALEKMKGANLVLSGEGKGIPADKVIVEKPPTTIAAEFFENFRTTCSSRCCCSSTWASSSRS